MHVLSMPAVDATESDLLDQGLFGFVKHNASTENVTRVKGKVLIIYIAVLRNRGLLQDRNNTPLIIGPIHGSYMQRLSI